MRLYNVFQKQIWVAYLIIFLVLSSISISVSLYNFQRGHETVLNKFFESSKLRYLNAINNYESISKLFVDSVLLSPDIIKLLQTAQTTQDKNELNTLREKLLNSLTKEYEVLKKNYLYQVHFHLADGTSFLRLHKPKEFGDDLTHIRPSIAQIMKEHKMMEGFEIGRHWSSYRYLYPIFADDGSYVGSVETSLPFVSLMSVMNKISQSYNLFITDKKFTKQRIDPIEIKAFKKSFIDDLYVLESVVKSKKLYIDSKTFLMPFGEDIAKGILNKHQTEIKSWLLKKQPFSYYATWKNKYYVIAFLPITSINTQEVGAYVVTMQESIELDRQHNEMILILCLLHVVILFLIFFIHYFSKKRAQQSYLEIFHGVTDGIALHHFHTGKIIKANNAFCELYGYTFKELQKKNLLSLNFGLCSLSEEEFQNELKKLQQQEHDELILECKRKNGTLFWAQITIKSAVVEGAKCFISVIKDISKQIEQEKKLQIYKKIVSASKDNLLYLDKYQRHQAVNESFLNDFNFTKEQVIGKTPKELFGEEIYNIKIKTQIEKAYHGILTQEQEWMELAGERFYKQITHIPYIEAGDVEGVVVNIHNMSDWKLAQEQLEELKNNLEEMVKQKVEELRDKDTLLIKQSRFAALGEMISMIAHQWRQPLNILSIYVMRLQMLEETKDLNLDKIHEIVKKSNEMIQGMSKTIDDFATFFKPENKKGKFSLNGSIDKAISMIEYQLENYNIKMHQKIDEEIELFGISNELQHVLLILFGNARDILNTQKEKKEKYIIIQAVKFKKSVKVTISDNGGGVPDEIKEKIFDPYFTTKHSSVGTGIGLYMAKTIIEQHFEGTIVVDNNDHGAEFKITLPLK